MAMREKKARKKGGGFFSGLISELKKVVYPSRKTVQRNTVIVIVSVIIVGIFISLLDFGFDAGRRAILSKTAPSYDLNMDDIDNTDNVDTDIDWGDLGIDSDNIVTDEEGNPMIIVPSSDSLEEEAAYEGSNE